MKEDNLSKWIVGLVAICTMFFFASIPDVGKWFFTTFLSTLISLFFIMPISYAIVYSKIPKTMSLVIIGAVIAYIVYIYIFQMAWYEIALSLLQSIVFISVILSIANFVYKQIEHVIR